jgi:undecaprenyl diphosphate synthase
LKLEKQIDFTKVPKHVAIIMDGNGRWAQKQGQERLFGHQNGIRPIRTTMEACKNMGIRYLTLYTFSTENWKRPQDEIEGLWDLLTQAISDETETLQKNNIRFNVIGNMEALSPKAKHALQECLTTTQNNNAFVLTLALNYGGRNEIITAAQTLAQQALEEKIKPENIDEQTFADALMTAGMPDPDLIIRTGGEERISNFLLWQAAYAELYFTSVLWPDFNEQHFYDAITAFQHRERRLGTIMAQYL